MRRTASKHLFFLIIAAVTVTALTIRAIYAGGGDGYVSLGVSIVVCVVIAAVLLAIGVLAGRGPLGPVSPEPGERPDYEELYEIYNKLDEQTRQLRENRETLQDRDNKLRAITENMAEGLVLLDSGGGVLFINRAAERVLGTIGEDVTGRHILAISCDNMLQAAVHNALGGKSANEIFASGNLTIRAVANPVMVDGAANGAVLMLIDISTRQAAEDMRREFSANVSHELKTPITSISGYAELMKSGIVPPGDISKLSEKMYDEAQRLIELIDDIIKLSRLDENSAEDPIEEVALNELARDCARRLGVKADRYGVRLIVEGDKVTASGSARLIDEMISNLIDNAIKYNRPGGRVRVLTQLRGEVPVLTVEDDGIGIAPEDMERIFERFYRVDKSRSKDTGGTGLGLSIVKHAAAWHGASVEADSMPGRGTRISIVFDGKGEE